MIPKKPKHSSILSMSVLFIMSVFSSIYLVACSSNHHADGKLIQNISGDFRVSGFLGTSYYIKIKDNVLSYRTHKNGISSEWEKQPLTAEDISQLENTLIELDAMNWNSQYRNPDILDGTQWSIHYSSKKIKVKSNGSNKYPNTYKALTRYISTELLKGKPFG